MIHIPNYHFRMLNDHERNQAFYDGLKAAIIPGVSHVLDLGAGTCLLSMFAAKLGARRVTAIERHPKLAEVCSNLLEENGVSDKVTVIIRKSTDVVFGQDGYDEIADILVSETFDSWIIEEGFFPSLADLRDRNLIGPKTIIVPSSASLHLQLGQTLFSFDNKPHSIMGLNYESVRAYRPKTSFVEDSLRIVHKNLSSALTVFSYDFNRQKKLSEYFNYIHLKIPIVETGVIHAGCFWFTMNLDQEKTIVLSNKPGTINSSWNQIVKLFEFGDIHVKAGSHFDLLIAQMPQRYAFATPFRDQRIIKISSTCRRPVELHGSARDGAPEDLNYLFSFYGGIEYNVWISFPGQQFEAFADYSKDKKGKSAYCVDADTGEPYTCRQVSVAKFTVDTTAESEENNIPLYEYKVSC